MLTHPSVTKLFYYFFQISEILFGQQKKRPTTNYIVAVYKLRLRFISTLTKMMIHGICRVNSYRMRGQASIGNAVRCLSAHKAPIHNTFSKLAIIGGGQMCEAFLGGLKVKGVQEMSAVTVCDLHEKRLQYLQDKFGVQITSNVTEAAKDAELTIISVKPQNLELLSKHFQSSSAPSSGLILSIVAGVPLADLRRYFRSNHIIRSMPNTPAMVLEGITVWIATKETPVELKDKAKTLLNSFGDQIEVFEEHYIDMATAVSGSGPAYVFLTMEAMIDAAVHLGFQRDIATKLVIATIKGSATYAEQTHDHSSKLRNNVTSPGGTTASALYEFERGGYRTVVADAIWAAYRRTLELGGKNSNVGPGRFQSGN